MLENTFTPLIHYYNFLFAAFTVTIRALQMPYSFLSFIDLDRQWVKSSIGLDVSNPNIDRRDSIDSLCMFPETPEVLVIFDLEKHPKYKDYLKHNPFGDEHASFKFYAGAVVTVEGFRVGVLSVLDDKPSDYLSLDNRQNLLDLAAAISNILKDRRLKYMRQKKERANLMLGLNHNLRTPVRTFPHKLVYDPFFYIYFHDYCS